MTPPPEIRAALRRFRRRRFRRWGAERAALAVTVVSACDGPAVLLTRGVDALSTRAGQLALPGQWVRRWESAPAAARGQLADRFGMHLPPESVLGLLDDYVVDDLRGRASQVITPVVVWAGEHTEKASLNAVRFADLDVEPVFVSSADAERPEIRLPVHGEWLHAPTAAVLHQFRELVLYQRRSRVAIA
jgi:ADP-ribose pyrophosphatase YjhB (NUDIX family)